MHAKRSNGVEYSPNQIFRPVESMRGFFQTSDRRQYQRNHQTDEIRRVIPKLRGKAARREDKRMRMIARGMK